VTAKRARDSQRERECAVAARFCSRTSRSAQRSNFQVLQIPHMVRDAAAVLEQQFTSDPAAREEWLRTRKLKNDPRITGIGRLLHHTGIDELSQLINVLLGEMSLVGRRP
jgi:lipopolysaccharide/colanic/teichoic acid biosynthesis glycosyltransferase